MRTAALILLLLCAAAAPARAQDTPAYGDLLARAQAGDTTVDYTALRLGWAASPGYAPYASAADEHTERLGAALQRHDWASVVREADAVLAVTWLDARTHMFKAYAIGEMGDSAAARREAGVAIRLVRSMMAIGKGTKATPFVVVSVAEEYAFLDMQGLEPGDQGLDRCGERTCDRMDATNPRTGEKHTFYFDVTLPTGQLRRSMLGGAGKP